MESSFVKLKELYFLIERKFFVACNFLFEAHAQYFFVKYSINVSEGQSKV